MRVTELIRVVEHVGLLVAALSPIFGLAVMVRYRDDFDAVVVNAIDQAVGKVAQYAASERRVERMPRMW